MGLFMKNKTIRIAAFSLIVLTASTQCWAAASHLNTEELLKQADLVLVGEVISVDQDIQTTQSQIRVLKAIKGGLPAGSLVTVRSGGGKVFIDENEPSFMSPQHNLLFLQKDGEDYICVNRGDGQKIIRNDNLYPFHDNGSYSVPLKDYLKALEATIKALTGPIAESARK